MGQASTSPLVGSPRVREAYILILVTREAREFRETRHSPELEAAESFTSRSARRNMIR
jgi:hypothetical protein